MQEQKGVSELSGAVNLIWYIVFLWPASCRLTTLVFRTGVFVL
jgi:hypothetical protein